jgi:hypothetical protein
MNVPFAFETSSQHYPAGVYTIRMEGQHLVRIWGTSVAGLSMALVEDNGAPAKKGMAVFQRYGDRYFLNEISITGRSGGVFFVRRSRRHSCRSLQEQPHPLAWRSQCLRRASGR